MSDGYGVSIDAYIKYQRDHVDRVEPTDEEKYMEENKRIAMEEMIATKLLEVVSQDDLENAYYETQKEWAETLPDEELEAMAKDLGLDF